jgi:hypothetical protein
VQATNQEVSCVCFKLRRVVFYGIVLPDSPC